MKIASVRRACIAAAIAAMAASSVQALPTQLFGVDAAPGASVPPAGNAKAAQASFLLTPNLTAQTETFEGSPLNAVPTAASPLGIFGGTGSLTQGPLPQGSSAKLGEVLNSSTKGRFNTTTGVRAGQWWEAASAFTIRLNTAASAFGFYATDLGEFFGGLTFDLYLGGNLVRDEFGLPSGASTGTDGSLTFFGYVDDEKTFDQIVINVNQQAGRPTDEYDYVGFDDLIVGRLAAVEPPPTDVPEPATLALAGLSLGLLSLARRRSRK